MMVLLTLQLAIIVFISIIQVITILPRLQSLNNNTSGYNNAAFGLQSLQTNIDGIGNTAVGVAADVNNGSLENATAIGYFANVNASNKVRIGNGDVTVVESAAGSWTVSDGRFKNNIKENVKGLEFIKLLKPVTYNFDTKKFEEFLMQNYPDSIKKTRLAEMNKESLHQKLHLFYNQDLLRRK